ncbi:acyltransferase family protein [Rhodococcus sp. NPDC058521]|uniref:acyltransferase family protein n=1 Tax=Rhodococcus sp. NPDC058521 TaxID=3346536 RepID=UPI00364A24E7
MDGLRGVAIALVVVYHVWFGRVSGGVDVFLVLSGFFFTGMLLRRAESEAGPSIPTVVRRTVRRLFPALIIVLAATTAATAIQRPFTQWSALADQAISSILHIQNWELARTSADYQAADASVSPMQHLWSMSVQVQYYLLALALIAGVAWWCRRTGHRQLVRPLIGGVIVVGLVSSFVYAALRSQEHQMWTYYDTFARLWELLAGAGIALVIHRITLPRPVKVALAIAGIAVVIGCGFVVDGGSSFPGPAALIPVGATLALILAGTGPSGADSDRPGIVQALATRPFVELGAIAYSLYLWHWPILIFYLTWRERPEVGALGGLAVVVVSLVVAWVTYRVVEAPMSGKAGAAAPARFQKRTIVATICILGVAIVGATGSWKWYLAQNPETTARVGDLDPWLYPGAATLTDGTFAPHADMRPTVLEAEHDVPQPTTDLCITDLMSTDVVECTYGDPDAATTISVVGSSHAEHWIPALDLIGKERGIRVQTLLKMGCPVTVNPVPMLHDVEYPGCGQWSSEILDRLSIERPDWVFTTASRPNEEGPGDITPDDYLGVWERLGGMGIPLLGMRDTPWLHEDGSPYGAPDCLADGGDAESCGLPRDYVLDPVNPVLAAAENFPLVHPLDMSDAVCDAAICRVVEGNVLVYHDSHHLSATYTRTLAPELDRQIGAATGLW